MPFSLSEAEVENINQESGIRNQESGKKTVNIKMKCG